MKLFLAGLNVEAETRYEFVERLTEDYRTESEKVDISVSVSDSDIEYEAAASDVRYGKGYLESIALYRKIAERLPFFDAVVFHGAVIAYKGKAYAFTARSGVGKTTHIRLWLERFGKSVHILNGDKPILRVIDGKIYAAGTPWRGKEGYGIPEMLPLEAVAFIDRAEKPSANEITASAALTRFASQIYVPNEPRAAALSLSVLNKVISGVRLYDVSANMETESAETSFAALTGEDPKAFN
ncbi:MAG: hypothetical protein E7673_05135 [Ruminococcaceae bacterium]|nr:hypothetical protein [Oscillospiraceae bacterium]